MALDAGARPNGRFGLARVVSFSPDAGADQRRLEEVVPHATQREFSPSPGVRLVIWGDPAHREVPRRQVPAWIADQFKHGRLARLEELLGPFVILLDDARREGVMVATDPLGILPVFATATDREVLVGGDAWDLARERRGPYEVEPTALASWLWFGFDCTSHSFFRGIERLPAGSVTSVRSNGWRSEVYVDLLTSARNRPEPLPMQELAGRMLDYVRKTTAALLSDRGDAIIALSGGWDSRLLAACAVEAGHQPLAVCVENSQGDASVATNVADRLGLDIDVIRPSGHLFDLYRDPYAFTASGFPITRFVTHEIARRYAGRAMLNGFLGDSIVRGSHDRICGKLESEERQPIDDLLVQAHSMASGHHLLRPKVAASVRRLASLPLTGAIEASRDEHRACQWVDLTIRQRFYIANNFLLHLEHSEPLLPFYDSRLIRLKLSQAPASFGRSLYEEIFAALDPGLRFLSATDSSPVTSTSGIPRYVRRMALSLLKVLLTPGAATFVERRKAVPRVIAALAGRTEMGGYVKYLYGIRLLEERFAEKGKSGDWPASLAAA